MSVLSPRAVALVAQRCRALGEPTRVRIVAALGRGGQPVSQIVSALGADQSNISKHLQVLFHAGLVTRERSASTVTYALAEEGLIDLCRALAGQPPPGRRAARQRAPTESVARAAVRTRRGRWRESR
jgi:DNA-binding transcriptional ArsR family regulator